MTHPDHLPLVRRVGTIAGLPIDLLQLDMAAHPERPRPALALNSVTTWARVGAAPWTLMGRTGRVRQWMDPPGSPWAVADLVDVLVAMEMPGPEDGDWPEGAISEALPIAQRRAAERYASLALRGAAG